LGAGAYRQGLIHAADRSTVCTADGAVKRLVCEDCGTVYYSAAAKTLVEQGAVCAKCGGRLVYDDEPERKPVGGGPRGVTGNGG
jgi:NAD-dependent SIR2 family protein deacetylase